MYIADLHIHSKYSRATSRECVPEYLDLWARRKGIDIVGTGDFTHPAWREELNEKLVPAEEGLYTLREEFPLARRLYGRAAASPLCGDGRNQFHLQKGRQGPQGTQRHPSSQPRGGGNARAKAGGNRQRPFGRAADSGIGLPRPAGNHLGGVPGRGLHPGAHLDAALLAVRRVLRV